MITNKILEMIFGKQKEILSTGEDKNDPKTWKAHPVFTDEFLKELIAEKLAKRAQEKGVQQ